MAKTQAKGETKTAEVGYYLSGLKPFVFQPISA
jgi:hypothetical protein